MAIAYLIIISFDFYKNGIITLDTLNPIKLYTTEYFHHTYICKYLVRCWLNSDPLHSVLRIHVPNPVVYRSSLGRKRNNKHGISYR